MDAPVIWWLRRDLRLVDNAALAAVAGRPVIPVYILDPLDEAMGAAPRWRLAEGLRVFGEALAAQGARLILRRGEAGAVLRDLVAETGATGVVWQRNYEPAAVARDTAIKAALADAGVTVTSVPGQTLHEPWDVATGQGGPYRVYTPFWKAVKDRPVAPCLPPVALRGPDRWPASDRLEDWGLGADMRRGAAVVARHALVGEAAALARLDRFLDQAVLTYKDRRDFPALPATSGLSEPLAWGEISPRRIWHAAFRRWQETGSAQVEHFLKELVWRDFAWHLAWHTPHLLTRSWRPEWDAFPWAGDSPVAESWRRGRTGVTLVDTAMREMYVTGRMHNRARMIVASYLTKHLLTDWRIGQAWFAECLTDWDPASNAMGWQWVAGCGPDAAPYFRIFNPDGQAEKFDPDGAYRRRWLAEGTARPAPEALQFYEAIPRAWGLSPADRPARPAISLAEGRARALEAYAGRA